MEALNSGKHIWVIKGDLLRDVMNAKYNDKFESNEFEMVNLKWKIIVVPMGCSSDNNSNGSFMLGIKPLLASTNIESIVFCRSLRLVETKSSDIYISTLENGDHAQWGEFTLRNSQIQKMQPLHLTIIVEVNIVKIKINKNVSQNDFNLNYSDVQMFPKKEFKIEWVINHAMLVDFRRSINGTDYYSKIFNNLFYLKVYPNGQSKNNEGDVGMFLGICIAPYSDLQIKFECDCKSVKCRDDCTDEAIFNLKSQSWGNTKFMKKEEFMNVDSLVLTCDVRILDDNKENEKFVVQRRDMNHDPSEICNANQIREYLRMLSMPSRSNEMAQNMKHLNTQMETVMKTMQKMQNYVFEEEKNDTNLIEEVKLLNVKLDETNRRIDNMESNKKRQNPLILSKKDKFRNWLKNEVELEEYFDLFIDNGFDDLGSLKHIGMNELNLIGINKIGHKMKLLRHIMKLANPQGKKQSLPSQEGHTLFM